MTEQTKNTPAQKAARAKYEQTKRNTTLVGVRFTAEQLGALDMERGSLSRQDFLKRKAGLDQLGV